MKMMKKLSALALAIVMMLAMTVTAFAQNVPEAGETDATKGKITISNASKGETYSIHKLFGATVTGNTDGSIAYAGEIPTGYNLEKYFEYVNGKDASNGIKAKAEAITKKEVNGKEVEEMSDGLKEALKAWAAKQKVDASNSVVSDGSELVFRNLEYGYYVVTTTQGDQAVSVTSTNPTVSIVDKNSTKPSVPSDLPAKKVNDADVYIGQEVEYTLNLATSNFEGAGESAKRITEYTITDSLPEFLTLKDNAVTSITITKGTDVTTLNPVPQFENKKITIPWTNSDGSSKYANGSILTVTYKATVNDKIKINTDSENSVTFSWKTEDGNTSSTTVTGKETIRTYALSLKKIDEAGKALAGATFTLNGYTVKKIADGYYKIQGRSAYDETKKVYAESDVMTCDKDGLLVVEGLASKVGGDGSDKNQDIEYVFTEVSAPAGYNKLTETKSTRAQVLTETVTTTHETIYRNAAGVVVDTEVTGGTSETTVTTNLNTETFEVENHKGSTLPSTGGIGTTIFYVVGGVLVVAAVVLLVTKKRMSNRA